MQLTSTIQREIFALYCMVQTDILLGSTVAFAAYYDSNASQSGYEESKHARSLLVIAGRILHPIGALMDMYFIEKFGRKTTLQYVLTLGSFGWILTAVSSNFLIVFLSRVLLSFLIGVTSTGIVYVIEMTMEKRQSFYVSIFSSVEELGYLITNLLEYLLGWRIAAVILAVHFGVTVALVSILPESKYWYIKRNNDEAASKSVMWFNGYRKEEADEEVSKIRQQVHQLSSKFSFLQCMKTASIFKFFALCCLIEILRIGTGFEIFIGYSTDFWELYDVPYNPRILPLIFECVSLVSAVIISVIISCRVKTRNIFVCLSGIMSLTATLITLRCLFLQKSYPLFLTVIVFIYMLSSGGLSQLILAAIPEFFPETHCSSIIPAFCVFTFFVQGVYLSLFPLILGYTGFTSIQVFFLFNAVTVCLVSYFCLSKPGVEAKSTQESIEM